MKTLDAILEARPTRKVGLPSDPNPHRREHPLPEYTLLPGVQGTWRSAEWLQAQKIRYLEQQQELHSWMARINHCKL